MMSPDPEMQRQEVDEVDEVELVGLSDHNQRSSARRRQRHSRNTDYQVVVNDASSFDEEEEYNSGEDEGLISNLSVDRSEGNNLDDYFYYGFSTAETAIDWRCAFWLVVSFLLATCLAVVLPGFNNFGKPIVGSDGTVIFPNGTKTNILVENASGQKLSFLCPVIEDIQEAENYHNTSVEESYINRTSQITNNFTGFLENYQESEFDGWGKPYSFVKAGMYHWKSTRFPKNLKDGNRIYESACGIGLNIIMTLEILQEVKGVTNLIVYGNEYIPSSANTSNKILDALLPPLNATRGSVCAADSTNLNHVPANSMDLVFTGYISTLLDPLNIDMGVKDNYQYYESICEGETWQDKKLKDIAQQRQEDWFGQWVSEMVRIAKPGCPIIIEQVSYPFCEAYFDWGGVGQDFWTDYAIDKYGWDVDPTTIEFEDDRLFRKRYHVFMRKRGSSGNTTDSMQSVPPPTPANDGNNGGG